MVKTSFKNRITGSLKNDQPYMYIGQLFSFINQSSPNKLSRKYQDNHWLINHFMIFHVPSCCRIMKPPFWNWTA